MAFQGPVVAGPQKGITLGSYTTAQRNSGVSTATGTIIYNTTNDAVEAYLATNTWAIMAEGNFLNSLNPLNDGSQVAYYKFEQNGNDQHGSFNSTGMQFGTASYTATTRSFYWNNPSSSTFTLPTVVNSYPFSVSALVQIPSGTGWSGGDANRLIVNTGIGGQRVTLALVDWSNNNVDEWTIMYGGTNHWTFAPTSRPTDTWIHVVYSVVGSNNSSHAVYQNGVSCTGSNRGGGHGGTAGWRLGGNTDSTENFSGYIYNIRVFNKALSASEANTLYLKDTVL